MSKMIQTAFLDKSQKDKWLPDLFGLYYSNMSLIAPSELSFENERSSWISEVSQALDKAPRKIILCSDGDELLGYIQYYTRNDLLMIEEIQIRKDYQKTLLFYKMCRYLAENIPSDILCIEAYAHKQNQNSQKIMQKLGMTVVQEDSYSKFIHMRGDARSARKRFL